MESVALGEAAGVEHGFSPRLLDRFRDGEGIQPAQVATGRKGRDERPRRESAKRRALRATRRSNLQEGANRVSKPSRVLDVPNRHRPSKSGRSSGDISRA